MTLLRDNGNESKETNSDFTLAQDKCMIPCTVSPLLPFMGWHIMAALRLVAVTPGPYECAAGVFWVWTVRVVRLTEAFEQVSYSMLILDGVTGRTSLPACNQGRIRFRLMVVAVMSKPMSR